MVRTIFRACTDTHNHTNLKKINLSPLRMSNLQAKEQPHTLIHFRDIRA